MSLYPRLTADGSGSGVVSQAGAVTLVRAADATCLTAALSAALAPWRRSPATHDPGQIICNLAISLAIGGDCLPTWRCCCPTAGVRCGGFRSDGVMADRGAGKAPKALAAQPPPAQAVGDVRDRRGSGIRSRYGR